MIVKLGESRQIKVTSGSYDGVTITAKLFAKVNNFQLGATDWNPQAVQVKVTLKRQKQTFFIFNDNLQILGHFNTMLKGQFEFYQGIDLIYPTSSVKNVRCNMAKLFFGGVQRVNMSDEMVVEVNLPSSGLWSTNVDETTSFVEFDIQSSVGYERGIWVTESEVVQEKITKQTFSAGDLVTDIALLNFNKDTLYPPILQTLNLSSDRLDLNLNFEQSLLNTMQQFGFVSNMRYSGTLPWASSADKVFRALDFFPQMHYIIGGKTTMGKKELNKVKVDATFASDEVAASQNYFVCRRFITSRDILASAEARMVKHAEENIGNIPQTITGADYRKTY